MSSLFVLARALTYTTFFVGFLLVFLPAGILRRSGIVSPDTIGAWQVAGMLAAVAGTALALWCILTFVLIGRGTPAPFDPPRRLVDRGPYGFVRNPMYIGATAAVLGASIYYQSPGLLAYAVAFLLAMQALVIGYEEPTLRRMFGQDYDRYCKSVGRWWPRLR